MKSKRSNQHDVLRRPTGGRLLSFFEQHRRLRALLVGLLAVVLTLLACWTGSLERIELKTYDWRVRALAPPATPSPAVVVVAFDEQTLAQLAHLGQWGAWPRSVFSELVKSLKGAGARVIVFDLLFADSNQSGDDADFAVACREAGNVVSACSFFDGPAHETPLPSTAERHSLTSKISNWPQYRSAVLPYPDLLDAVHGIGGVQLDYDLGLDNVVRRNCPAANWNGCLWPSLSFAAVKCYYDSGREKPSKFTIASELDIQPISMFFVSNNWNYTCWQTSDLKSTRQRYRTISAGWVLTNRQQQKKLAAIFEGKIVIVGASASGAFEQRVTSIGLSPGMYIHAVNTENLLQGLFVRRVSGSVVLLLTLFLSVLLAFSFPGKGSRAVLCGVSVWFCLAGGYLLSGLLFYRIGHIWLDLVVPQASLSLSLLGSLLCGYVVEGREVRRTRRALARFLSPQVLADISDRLDDLRPGMGRRTELTMMFADIRNFTTMSEKLDADQVMKILELYLGIMTDLIMASGGTLSKYLGDGIMAFWGAPQEQPDHALLASQTALAMIAAQEEIKAQLRADGKPTFDIGIGLHTGVAVVGTVGSEQRLEYTAIGDMVNLASRVESLTKKFGVRIIVTGELKAAVGCGLNTRDLGSVTVKGRQAEVEVFELLRQEKAEVKTERQ
jgi:adenylate cyclase